MIASLARFSEWMMVIGHPRTVAASYRNYLSRADRVCGGIDEWLAKDTVDAMLDWLERQPDASFGGSKQRRDSLSAVRKFATYLGSGKPASPILTVQSAARVSNIQPEDAGELLHEIRSLGTRYLRLTGKPLGVTGEVAELVAAELLGLRLCEARQAGFDAWDDTARPPRRVQIKGRAVDATDRYRGRCPAIRCGNLFDDVILVLLDKWTLEPLEILLAEEASVERRLAAPGSKARNERASLAIRQFRSIARRVWPIEPVRAAGSTKV
jgi:hypothetical protein